MFAQATTAASQSPAYNAWQASYRPVNEDEQAVLMVTLERNGISPRPLRLLANVFKQSGQDGFGFWHH
jgi:hypothetical protein